MATIKRHGVDVSDKYTPTEYGAISLDERALDGETGQGTMPIPDPSGTAAMYSGQSLEILVGATQVFKGFIGGRSRDRSEAAVGTRLVNSHAVVDQNALLTGFRSGLVNRPSETDYARMLWFFQTFLPSLDTTWVLNTNTQTVPAKTYNTDSLWQEVFGDCHPPTGKTGFVEGGRAHWHLPTEGIATGKAISDLDADWGANCYEIRPGVKFGSDPLELDNDVRVENSQGQFAVASDATSKTNHDADGILHQVLIQTDDTSTSLSAQAAAAVAANKDEKLTYECDIGPLTAAQVNGLPVGSLITVTSFVMGLTAATQRIAERVITIRHLDRFFLHLLLSYPIRRNLGGTRTINPVTKPVTTPFDVGAAWAVTANNLGDPTKAAYLYITAGGPSDAIISDQLTLAGPRPNINISFSADSVAGDGTGVTAGSNVFNRPYPSLPSSGIQYPFKLGVPVIFSLYAKYNAAGGTMYSQGNTRFNVNVNGTAVPFPGMVVKNIAVAPSSTAPGGTICLGSFQVTYYPGGFADPSTAKGDLIGHDGSLNPIKIPATATPGNVLTEDPTQASGWISAPPASGRTFPFFCG